MVENANKQNTSESLFASRGQTSRGFLWIVFAVVFIALTVLFAAIISRPKPLELKVPPSISEAGVQEDLDFDRIQSHIKTVSSYESRITGYEGSEKTLDYIRAELESMGLRDYESYEFQVGVPIVENCFLEVTSGGDSINFPLDPLWPNLARTCQTDLDGITGELIDLGRGTDSDLSGKELDSRIAVMNWGSRTEWLSVPEFSGKAVLFRADGEGDGYTAREKFLTIPADIPRFYVRREHLPLLDSILSADGAVAKIICRMGWKKITTENLLVRVSGAVDNSNAKDVDNQSIIFHAYYDSISVVPSLSPGAEQACGMATLLEAGRYFAEKEFERPIYLLFTGGHGQALSGMTDFVRTLKDLDTSSRSNDNGEKSSLLVRMGKPALFCGLDLSSRSDRMGIFAVGRFRGQYEHLLRPKFSTLGLRLSEYAESFRPETEEDDPIERLSHFVDCINLTLGRGWWTYFPYQAPFESELPTMAGMPGITLSTINDDRRYIDTPDDTVSNMKFDLLSKQLLAEPGRKAGIVNMLLALASWSGPFVGSDLNDVWARLDGRVVWLDQKKDYTPNEPLTEATVFLKTQRGDKYLMGTRGIPMVMTDEKGQFQFDGLIQITNNEQFRNCTVEPFGVADEDFVLKNEDAYQELLKVQSKRTGQLKSIPMDGSIIYAVDMARAKEYPWTCAIEKKQQNLNLVAFPCRAFTLLGLTDPRGYVVLEDLTILEAGTQSPPFEWGTSKTDFSLGNPEENCITLWANPTLEVRLLLGVGFLGKRLILVNNSLEDPIGEGFVLADLNNIPSMVLQGARDMWNLDESRIQKLEFNGVENPRIRKIHAQAKTHLELATQALANNDYETYRSESEKGWSLESKAYGEVLSSINNMIRGVLFYLALLLPFSYCMERLLFASSTIRNRLILMSTIFTASFIVLAIVHPAFRFTMTPLIVLLAFVILALASTVSILILGKMDGILQERKHASVGKHEDTTNLGNITVRAVDLGIANIRRRPQRGFLTGATIVLVTFILLSFTSLVPVLNVAKVKHPEGVPTYEGLLVRERNWETLPNPLRNSLSRNFSDDLEDEVGIDSVVAARSWFFSDFSGQLSQIDISPTQDDGGGRHFTAVALLCMESTEPQVTDVGETLVAGQWFENDKDPAVILPLHVAETLGIGSDEIGRKVRIFGEDIPVVGIINENKFDEIEDIDGEPLTPVNFVLQSQIEAQNSGPSNKAEMLQEYAHYPVDQVVILPLSYGRRIGATFRSVAVKTGPTVSPEEQARDFAVRTNQTILACDGEKVTLFASLDSSKLTGAGHIVVPLLLGFLIVLGTMLGSVFERRKEIFIYNSVGLSPINVSSLFMAESCVYAIIGASSGYLLGQVVAKVLLFTGALSGLSLNYSAGSAIFVTVSTMFIVLFSTIYPAREAFLAAIPESDEEVQEEDHASNSMHIYLPFVAAPEIAFGMYAYLYEYLQSIQGVSVGKLGIDNLIATVEESQGQPLPVLQYKAWLAPFDLGVSHDARMGLVYREDRAIYQFYVVVKLFSGDQQSWHRLMPNFVQALRKQLLMWRVNSEDIKQEYVARGKEIFLAETVTTDKETEIE